MALLARILGFVLVAAVRILLWLIALLLAFMLLTPPGWCLALMLAVMAYQIIIYLRRHRATMLLGYLEQAVVLHLPLVPMLAAAERNETGTLQKRLADLRVQLEGGASIGEALDTVAVDLSPQARTLLVSAERLGRLPTILRYLLKHDRRQRRQNPDHAVAVGYGVGLLFAMWLIMGGAMIFIVPNLDALYDDFEVVLPATTTHLIAVSQWLAGRSPGQSLPGVILVGAVVALGAVVAGLMRFTRPGRYVLGNIVWCLPIAHGITRDRSLAHICRLVSEATEAGVPLFEAMAESSRVQVNPVIRHRVRACARGCEAGEPIADAARVAGLPSVMANLLGSGEASSNIPRAFDYLARYYGNRFYRAYELMSQAAKPIMVLTFAVPAAWIAVGLFQPLVILIESVLPMGVL